MKTKIIAIALMLMMVITGSYVYLFTSAKITLRNKFHINHVINNCNIRHIHHMCVRCYVRPPPGTGGKAPPQDR